MFGSQECCELYDIEADPTESRNLASDPAHASVVAESRRRLLDWIITTSRPVTVHPSFDDKEPGRHNFDIAADGRESNLAGPRLRLAKDKLEYL